MKIAVAGIGYVGMSMGVLLSQHHDVTMVDVVQEKVDKVNNKISPLDDKEIIEYLANKELSLRATTEGDEAYKEAELVIIAAPTNYDSKRNFFDTSIVESVIEQVTRCNPSVYMIVKSTIPVGYTESVSKKYKTDRILFAPEFLRESRALYDNLYPARIIVGVNEQDEKMLSIAHNDHLPADYDIMNISKKASSAGLLAFSVNLLTARP